MTAPLQLFNTRNARFVNPDGSLTSEAIRMFDLLFIRVGGAVAPSTTDLSQSDDDDSGLEEFKHELSKSIEGLSVAPVHQEHSEVQHLMTELAGLREEVATLRAEVQGIQQGAIYDGNS